MPKQIGFLIDLNKCIGCKGCEMACQNEYRLGDGHRRKIITLAGQQESVFGFLSMACNHCANPACIAVCPNQCFKKRRDGIVLHNPLNCSGCTSCVGACPFGTPQLSQKTGKVDKCNFCVERLDKGLKPACVAACIPEALQMLDLSKPSTADYAEALPGFRMVRITNPSVRFILPQATKCYWRNC